MKTNINIKRISKSNTNDNSLNISIESESYRIVLHYFYSRRDVNGENGIYTISANAYRAAELAGEFEDTKKGFEDAVRQFHTTMESYGHRIDGEAPKFLRPSVDVPKKRMSKEEKKMAEAKAYAILIVSFEVKKGNKDVASLMEMTRGLLTEEEVGKMVSNL